MLIIICDDEGFYEKVRTYNSPKEALYKEYTHQYDQLREEKLIGEI
jgi:hypothetical protein